jgi:arylsulfatase A-like enzyme
MVFASALTCLVLTLAPDGKAAAGEKPGEGRPNVLFLAVDDLNDWVGCLRGHPQVKTPHIDRLARRGTLFTNAHCQAPLCNPSRSSLLTGLRPSTTGIYALQPGIRAVAATRDRVALPQALEADGYSTFCTGKIFHDGSIPPRDRDKEFQVWNVSGGMPYPPAKFVETPDPIKAMDWGVFPEDDRDQADWKSADAAIARLKNPPPGRPFFIAVGFRLPHVPCFASRPWFDLYPDESLVLPPVRSDDRADVPDFAWYLHWKLPEPRLAWLTEAKQWRPLVRSYLASISFMDSQVGRVLNALDASGQADRTIVVLWSDHGWHLGEKGITGKNTLWERSTRVPLIFAGPGIAAGAECAQPVELLDLYPTLVTLCRLADRAGLEGHSLAPQLKDSSASRPWPAITTHNPDNHSVRTEHWRYIRYADGSEELYDHRVDPQEWTNLANDPEHAERKRELAAWLPRTSAPPAPGSPSRLLVKENGVWTWERKPIVPNEKSR